MDYRIKVRSSFVPDAVHKEFYTGGNVQLSRSGSHLFCQCRNYVTLVDINSGIVRTIPPESDGVNSHEDDVLFEDDILTFTVSETADILATSHKSGLIKLWNWIEGTVSKSWKSIHKGPVVKLAFNSTNTYLATGGTDSSVRIWETDTMANVAKLGDLQGVTSILTYHDFDNKELLFTSGNEAKIFIWSIHGIKHKKLLFTLSGHFSIITSLVFSADGPYLVSCARDKVIMLWNLTNGKLIRTIPMYESLETGTILVNTILIPGCKEMLDNVGMVVAVGGETGNIRLWNVLEGKELYRHSEGRQNPLIHLIYHKEYNCLISVTSDQTIILNNFDEEFSVRTQFVGCNDEILDVTYVGENESYLAVAVNSCNINLYDEHMKCTLLKGHTDLVISLCSSRAFPNLLVSGSKDNSIKVWLIHKDGSVNCIASGSRHAASVNAVDISNVSSENTFVVSGSEDTTVKLWQLNGMKSGEQFQLSVTETQIAHEKPVNSVAISPNNKLIASGSQDKTAKLWSSSDLSLIGILKGHRRGVWCVKFSPTDQVLMTSSADGSIRLWSVANCSCLKTFEGHESSVLKCSFINKGIQIVSAGGDGLMKIWLIKTGECIATLDKHSGKIWALTVKLDDSRIVSGSSDSRLIVWRDNTEEELIKQTNAKNELVAQEQTLMNLLHANQLLPALRLTLSLDRPGQTLKIIQSILSKDSNGLNDIVTKLDTSQKEILLNYSCTWNTNSKYCYAAQTVFNCLKEELLGGDINLSEKALEGAIAYSDRHFKRITKLLQDVQLILYTERKIKPHAT